MDPARRPHPLSLSEIRALEKQGLDQGLPLMSRAGQCAAGLALRYCQPCHDVWLLVGPGNNGGDALTAGAHLINAGLTVTAIMPAEPAAQANDARNALKQWSRIGQSTQTTLPRMDGDNAPKRPDLVIDGLFGIGLNKQLGQPWQTMIDDINESGIPVLSLDIPSGMMADTGQCLGRPVRARWTVAFIAPSYALYDSASREFTGEWDVCTLGLQA